VLTALQRICRSKLWERFQYLLRLYCSIRNDFLSSCSLCM